MKRDEIRLECLKLAHTHGRSDAEAIARAKNYEIFVVGTEEESSESKVSRQRETTRKGARDPDLLS